MIILKSCFVIGLSLMVLGVFSLAQSVKQSSGCFTIEQIINLLEKKVDEKLILENVTKYKVDLALNDQNIAKLIRAGASDKLIEVIRKNPCSPTELKIIFPTPEAQCGAVVKIEGVSPKIQGKHLWIFSHVKFLKDQWWPQTGEVQVSAEGKWISRAYLGNANDIGYDFEIVAIWVAPTTNAMLEDYMNKCSKKGDYPSMSLPEGEPSTKVVVKKISH